MDTVDRFYSNTAEELIVPTMASEEEKKKSELRKKIEYQVKCDERAFRIVEKLIDNPVSHQYFLESLQHITPSHYQDIIEERAVSKLCGYPLCPAQLGNKVELSDQTAQMPKVIWSYTVAKQKFFISTKTNRVYDIEARKNFCSARCYKASIYLEKQISTEPVWARKCKPKVDIELLPLDTTKGVLGDEIILSKKEEMKKEVEKLAKIDKYGERLKQKHQVVHSDKGEDSIAKSESSKTSVGECVYDLERAVTEMKIETHSGKEEGLVEKDSKENVPETSASSTEVNVSPGSRLEVKVPNAVADNSRGLCSDGFKDTYSGKSSKGKHKPGQKPEMSKTDYLMQLLDKRKSLLGKMVDIQDSAVVRNEDPEQLETETVAASEQTISPDAGIERAESNVATLCEPKTHTLIVVNDDKQDVAKSDDTTSAISGKVELEQRKDEISQKDRSETSCVNNSKSSKVTKKTMPKENKKCLTLEFVARVFQSWITKQSLDYLEEGRRDREEEAEATGSSERIEFNRQYKELVAKVDAQEREFDEDLLGEVKMDDVSGPSLPAPDYTSLKQEAEQQQLRVREFLKGSFTYKTDGQSSKAETSRQSSAVKLPTVDRYDQLVLRQKIVLERVSKVLPEVLSPLNLLVQEVYTEVKDFVMTCNLTSKNIVFKPAEWLLVTLMLLKLLSQRMKKVEVGFTTQRAQVYYKTLLSGIGASLMYLDVIVTQLTQINADSFTSQTS